MFEGANFNIKNYHDILHLVQAGPQHYKYVSLHRFHSHHSVHPTIQFNTNIIYRSAWRNKFFSIFFVADIRTAKVFSFKNELFDRKEKPSREEEGSFEQTVDKYFFIESLLTYSLLQAVCRTALTSFVKCLSFAFINPSNPFCPILHKLLSTSPSQIKHF